MRKDDLFAKFHLEKPQRRTLDGKESIDDFIARGGQIAEIPSGVATMRETGRKKTAQENIDKMKHRDTLRTGANRKVKR